MDFNQSIDKLYEKFFNNKNFKNIDFPFISSNKQLKFLKVTNPKVYESIMNSRRKACEKIFKGKYKIASKISVINRRCQSAQHIITNIISIIVKRSGMDCDSEKNKFLKLTNPEKYQSIVENKKKARVETFKAKYKLNSKISLINNNCETVQNLLAKMITGIKKRAGVS